LSHALFLPLLLYAQLCGTALVLTRSFRTAATAGSLVMPMSAQLVACISKAWQDGVYLPVLAHRFWKLYLQVRPVRLIERAVLQPDIFFPFAFAVGGLASTF
jgi:hypothetical protein